MNIACNKFLLSAFVFAGLSLVCVTGAVSPIQAESEIKIGIVDIEKALAGSKAGAAAKGEFEEEYKKTQIQLERKKKELDGMQEQFDKQSKSLNPEAREKKYEELVNTEKSFKRSLQDSRESLKRKEAKLLQDLVGKIRGVVSKIGEDKGFTFILEKNSQSVLYVNDGYDITDEVVKRFNKLDN